jgi:hypothetical protein
MTVGSASKGADRARRDTGNPNSDLPTRTAMWPTPEARDHKGANQNVLQDRGSKGPPLNEVAVLWKTPRAVEGEKGGDWQQSGDSPPVLTLTGQADQWATPQARDHMPPHSPERIAAMEALGHGMRNLNDEAAMWMTPTSLNYDKSHQPGKSRSQNINMERAAVLSSRLDQLTSPDGGKPSQFRRSLNPLFVEWLMGWPPGWTLLAGTESGSSGFACSATALSLWSRRMRSALSQLAPPPEAPTAQLALFG